MNYGKCPIEKKGGRWWPWEYCNWIYIDIHSVFIWSREPVHFTGYCYKIPGYEFSKHGL